MTQSVSAPLMTKERLEREAKAVGYWHHSIDLGQGVVTDGLMSAGALETKLDMLKLPDLRGQSVLDIGAFDGFYSFEAERRGAARVVALDHWVWSLDLPGHIRYLDECKRSGIPPLPYDKTPQWNPVELPGKRGYDLAHLALKSRVDTIVDDFMTMDLDKMGAFDVVLYLGVLYHMQNPFESLKRVARVTRRLAIIETEAMEVPGWERTALWEFFGGAELNRDASNWWAPNERGVLSACRAAGFARAETVAGPPWRSIAGTVKYLSHRRRRMSAADWQRLPGTVRRISGDVARAGARKLGLRARSQQRYRLIVHAWK